MSPSMRCSLVNHIPPDANRQLQPTPGLFEKSMQMFVTQVTRQTSIQLLCADRNTVGYAGSAYDRRPEELRAVEYAVVKGCGRLKPTQYPHQPLE